MIDLHFVSTPNGHKVSIMLAETGLDHRVIPYNLLKGEHLGEGLAAIRWPALKAWYGRIAKRPAVIEGAAVPENDPAAGRVMRLDPDQWSALFGERMLNAVRS